LPTLYVYEHCRFCIRARTLLGLKGVRYNLVWFQNDDVQTPTKLVGRKVVPILELPGQAPMPESLDIVKRVDEDPEWGPPLLKPASDREDLQAWVKKTSMTFRCLLRPRVALGFFPEFAFKRARDAYVMNHPVPDPETRESPEKESWKKLGPDTWNAWYAAHLANSEALVKELQEPIAELESLIHSEESVSPGGLSYDDITFFDSLRAASQVKGLEFGPKALAYMKSMSKRSDVALLFDIAT